MSDATPRNYRDIENELMSAIAADLESVDGEAVTVTGYILVAEVMDDEGVSSVRWTSLGGLPYYRGLGMAEWLKTVLVDAMMTSRHDE